MNKVRVGLAIAGMTIGALALPSPAEAQEPGDNGPDLAAPLGEMEIPTANDILADTFPQIFGWAEDFQMNSSGSNDGDALASLGQLFDAGASTP